MANLIELKTKEICAWCILIGSLEPEPESSRAVHLSWSPNRSRSHSDLVAPCGSDFENLDYTILARVLAKSYFLGNQQCFFLTPKNQFYSAKRISKSSFFSPSLGGNGGVKIRAKHLSYTSQIWLHLFWDTLGQIRSGQRDRLSTRKL